MSLIDDLVAQFGLTPAQASGAVGAIARAAKDRLAPEHFAEFGRLVPGLDAMVAQAAAAGGGGMLGMLGGSLGQLARIAGTFEHLGIARDRIEPIAKAVLAWIRSHGSPALVAAIDQAVAKLGL